MTVALILKSAIIVSAAGALLLVTSQCAKYSMRHNREYTGLRPLSLSHNFDGEKFFNVEKTVVTRPGTFWKNMGNFISGDEVRRPPFSLAKFSADRELLHEDNGNLQITWMGHSTVLVGIDGRRFLTDPVWSDRVSPIPFLGPRRFFAPPCPLEDLPALDGIIISHDHYDHLDKDTIRWFGRNSSVVFFVPLGVGKHLVQWGISSERIRELDWWEGIDLGRHRLTALPARHFSGRKYLNGNDTLWVSWVIAGPRHRVYFGGDSGMSRVFSEIGERLGPFDVTMLEIGAFHENWSQIHLGPAGALQAHKALKGRLLMPIHWGTFTLAFHDWDAPVKELISGARHVDVSLLIPEPGATVNSFGESTIMPWWEKPAN